MTLSKFEKEIPDHLKPTTGTPPPQERDSIDAMYQSAIAGTVEFVESISSSVKLTFRDEVCYRVCVTEPGAN